MTVVNTRPHSFHSILEDCESDLRNGQGQRIEERLETLKLSELPRKILLPLAHIARRAGLFSHGLKILSPVLKPEMQPLPEEMAEYAVLLQKIGAMEEALIYLEKVDDDSVPDALLYRAYHHFHEWNGPDAIPHLRRYLASPIEPYKRAIGQVNLAAALILSERYDEALDLVNAAIDSNGSAGFVRLEGNCHEMKAQILLQRAAFKDAAGELDRAATLLGHEQTQDAFFVRKWRAILTAMETGRHETVFELKRQALARNDWETLREMDLYLSKLEYEKKRFDHLYFGTSFAAYRQRIERVAGRKPESREFVLLPSDEIAGMASDGDLIAAGKDSPLFDLESGSLLAASGACEPLLEPGSKPHQLLTALLRDLYRPLRVAGLFAALFPDEHYDPFTSPDRVHRLLTRARQALKKAELPVEIVHRNEGFVVKITGAVGIRLPIDRLLQGRNRVLLAKLQEAFPKGDFSSREGADTLGLSPSAFKRLAAWAIESELMEKIGAGSATFYRLLSKQTKGI